VENGDVTRVRLTLTARWRHYIEDFVTAFVVLCTFIYVLLFNLVFILRPSDMMLRCRGYVASLKLSPNLRKMPKVTRLLFGNF